MAISFLSSQSIDGSLTVSTIANETSAASKFLVAGTGGLIKYRTAAEVLSDIGAGTVNGTGTAGTVTKWSTGGTGIENGPITFSGSDSTTPGNFTLNTGTNRILSILASTHSASVAAVATLALGYSHSGGDAFGRINLVETAVNSFDANMFFSVPHNNGLGGSTSRTALSLFGSTLNATFAGDVTTSGTINVNRLAGATPYDNFKITTADIVTTLERVENTGDAAGGYGRLDFKTNASVGATGAAGRGGYKFINGDGDDILYLENLDASATFAGNVDLGDSLNISMSAASAGQLQVKGAGYTGAIALDETAMYIYHNSSLRDLVLGTNEAARLTIDGSSGNATFTGLVSGITPTAAANFTTKAYVDSVSGGTVGGTGTAEKVTKWSTGGADIEDGPITFSGDNSTFAGTVKLKTSAEIENHDTTSSQAIMYIDGKRTNGTDGTFGEIVFLNNGDSVATVAAFRDTADNKGSLVFQTQNGSAGFGTRLTIAADGSTTFNQDSEFKGRLSAQGGIEGLTLANGGITGVNYNISGVNELSINDPGEGIIFNGVATLTLAVIDDGADDKLKLTNATQLDLNSTARITNLVDPTSAQDAATKAYVDTLVSGSVNYIGTWSAADNGTTTGGTPDLTDTTLQVVGNYYICEVAGTAEPNGTGTEPDTWAVGDWVIYSDLTTDAWQKIDNSTVLSGAGVATKVAKWTDTETLSDGPITFNLANSTFAGSVTSVGLDSQITGAVAGYFASNTSIDANQIVHIRDNVATTLVNSAGGIKISSSPGNDVFLLKRNDGGTSYFALQNSSATEFITTNMASGSTTFSGNIDSGGSIFPTTNGGGSLGLGDKQWTALNLTSSSAITWANGDASIVEGEVSNYSLSFKTYDGTSNSTALLLAGNNNATFTGNVAFPNSNLSASATPTNFGVYNSEVRLIDTPNGGLQKCRVITDNYGEWIAVGRFASNAQTTIQGTWSSVSGLSLGTAQNETTQFSADFGDSYPSEVRIMGATDFTKWRDTRTIDFVYGVTEGRKWKNFFSGGATNGMTSVPRSCAVGQTRFGWSINGSYDGFGRWANPIQQHVGMSDTNVNNPSAAYTTATVDAFNWNSGSDAKLTVSADLIYSGQDCTEHSGVGRDDSTTGFFDTYPTDSSNMAGGQTFSSAVWVLIKLPQGTNSGGKLTDYWLANGNDISNTNSGNVGIKVNNPGTDLQVGGLDDGSNYNITLGWNAVSSQAVGTKRSALTFKTGQTSVNDGDIYKWDIAMLAATATVTDEEFGSDLAFLRSTRDSTAVDAPSLILGRTGDATFASDIKITRDILPVTTGASDLGTDAKRFGSLFANGSFIGTLTSTTIQLQGDLKILNKAQSAYIGFATRNTGGTETVMDITNAGSATFAGNITVNGNFIGNTANTTELGTYSTGAIKRIRMCQGGELHFGDTTTTAPLGITEGDWDDFGDQDRLSIYGRNSIKFYSGSIASSLSMTLDTNATFKGNVGVAGKTPAYGLTLAQGTGVGNKIVWSDSTPDFAASIYASNSTDKLTFATKNASNVETTALEIDTSQNATFAGGVTATTGTFSGNVTASTAGINSTLTVGTGASGTLRLQDSGTSYLSMYTANGVAFIQGAATGNTIFFGAPASFVQNINVAGTIDGDNFKVNGTQGSSGQVLTSSGSGVSWQTPSGGGSGTIGGSGTAGFVPRFSAGTTLGNTNIQNDGTNTTINTDNAIFQVTKPTNASNEPTFYVDTDENRVGFRTTSPNAAFDVNGTIKTLGFNANEQQFFVDPDNKYIKAGAYGSGEFFGSTGAANQPKYTFAAGPEGKFVEDERIETLKVSGNALDIGKTTNKGTVLLPTPGANSFYIIKEVNIYKTGGDFGVSNGVTQALAFGFCENGTASSCTMTGGSKAWLPWCTIPSTFFGNTGAFLWQSSRGSAISGMANFANDVATKLNRAFIMQSNSNVWTYSSNTVLYIQIKYSTVNVTAGFTNNVDRTVDDTGFTSGRTAFNAANGTVFNGVCTSTPGNPNANTFYFVNTSSNAGQSYPCNGDTVYTTQTGTTLLPSFYYYLYSGGGSRFYIQVINGIVSNQSGCTVQICSPPI